LCPRPCQCLLHTCQLKGKGPWIPYGTHGPKSPASY
jgi:hypothetical protein